jgi:hypothetical protein
VSYLAPISTAMYSRSPSICAQKWLRRGFVTFESSGQKKTVWSILFALKSSTTSTNLLAMIFLPSFAILRAEACLFCKDIPKHSEIRGRQNILEFRFLNHFSSSKGLKNPFFGFNLSVDFNLSRVGDFRCFLRRMPQKRPGIYIDDGCFRNEHFYVF